MEIEFVEKGGRRAIKKKITTRATDNACESEPQLCPAMVQIEVCARCLGRARHSVAMRLALLLPPQLFAAMAAALEEEAAAAMARRDARSEKRLKSRG